VSAVCFKHDYMSALSRASLLSLAFALSLEAAFADESGFSLGGFICARPFPPPCADQPATYQKAEDVSACQRELDRFVGETAAYRDCLERQIAGAIRQANDLLDRFRCLSRRECSTVVKPR